MIGELDKSTFDPERNYDEFYAGHRFEPMPEYLCYVADEVIPRVGWALEVAREIGAKNVLDLCCLDGFAALTLCNRLGIMGTGVDLSQPGIKLANERAAKRGLNARFYESPIEKFLLEPPSDLVLLFEAIEHFTDVDAAMTQIKRHHLKPGGTLLVSTPDAEGVYGIDNDDACHLRIFSHREEIPPILIEAATKPLISLPLYLTEEGFEVVETAVWNGLCHVRATWNG